MEDLDSVIRAHPFCSGLSDEQIALLVGCTRNLHFRGGEFLMREGQFEDRLYLIRRGHVALEAQRPGGDALCLETLGPGDVLGVSCITPHAAHLDCRAQDSVVALAIDNACLSKKMADDPKLGYAIAMRLLDRTYRRLARHRLQALDIYK